MMNHERQPKEVLMDFEQKMSLAQATEYFAVIAEKLTNEGTFSLNHQGNEIQLRPSSQVELEIKVEKQGNKYAFEIELEWEEGKEDGKLIIH